MPGQERVAPSKVVYISPLLHLLSRPTPHGLCLCSYSVSHLGCLLVTAFDDNTRNPIAITYREWHPARAQSLASLPWPQGFGQHFDVVASIFAILGSLLRSMSTATPSMSSDMSCAALIVMFGASAISSVTADGWLSDLQHLGLALCNRLR